LDARTVLRTFDNLEIGGDLLFGLQAADVALSLITFTLTQFSVFEKAISNLPKGISI